MNELQAPFRYDYVGSFLRPAALKAAREQWRAGQLSAQALAQVVDADIAKLIAKQ